MIHVLLLALVASPLPAERPLTSAAQAATASNVSYDLMIAHLCHAQVAPGVEHAFFVWGRTRYAHEGGGDALSEADAAAARRLSVMDQTETCAGADTVAADVATQWSALLESSAEDPEVLPSGRVVRITD